MMLTIWSWLQVRRAALKADHERGAAAVEYGLLVALIAAAIVVAVGVLGTGLNDKFCTIVTQLGFSTSCPTP